MNTIRILLYRFVVWCDFFWGEPYLDDDQLLPSGQPRWMWVMSLLNWLAVEK